ncbi:MAG: hypothetical protein ABWX74_09845 [Aeromicrobium sp.]
MNTSVTVDIWSDERLLAAYFRQGLHVSETYLPAVDADKERATAYAINGVPFFVVDGRFGMEQDD